MQKITLTALGLILLSPVTHATEIFPMEDSKTLARQSLMPGAHLEVDRGLVKRAREAAVAQAERDAELLAKALTIEGVYYVNGKLFQLDEASVKFLEEHFPEKELTLKVRRGGSSPSNSPPSDKK